MKRCRWDLQVVERAQLGADTGRPLGEHLRECPDCRERWEAEGQLTRGLDLLRKRALMVRSPEWRRDHLLQEFDRRHRPLPVRRWVMVAAAVAATLLIGLLVTGTRRFASVPAAPMTADTVSLSSDDFIAVPYAAPLDSSEIVTVVRTTMEPAELARLGIVVSSENDVDAEVVFGEDGLPRAVRVPDDIAF